MNPIRVTYLFKVYVEPESPSKDDPDLPMRGRVVEI